MTPRPSSPVDLVETLVELRAVLADERRAVARLDLAAVTALTERKHAIVAALEQLAPAPPDGELRRLLTRTRLELAANAALLAAARDGVAAVLGRTPDDCYDRRARRHSASQSLRTLTL